MLGYLFWTISDNWEWADGYGPKFRLVAVDRANNFARIPRPSYHFFPKVINYVWLSFIWHVPSPNYVEFAYILAAILNCRWQPQVRLHGKTGNVHGMNSTELL